MTVPTAEHFAEPPGVHTIETAAMLEAEESLDGAIRRRLIGAFTGTSGTGKTFTLQTLIRERQDVVSHYIEVPKTTTMKAIAEATARVLGTPIRRNRFDTAYGLIDALQDAPDGRALAIVFDEAQRINNECAEFLRSLHDNRDTRFSLLLAGGDGCWDVLAKEPMLISRVWEPVHFQAWKAPEEVLIYIPQYHEIYAEADPYLLLAINTTCEGIFRRWAARTSRILELMEREGTTVLTPQIAARACRRPVDEFVGEIRI